MSLVLIFHNKSALADVSDYDVTVRVGDGTRAGSRTLFEGEIKGHLRSDGWQVLVQRLLDDSR